jgi:hypothetical protein
MRTQTRHLQGACVPVFAFSFSLRPRVPLQALRHRLLSRAVRSRI